VNCTKICLCFPSAHCYSYPRNFRVKDDSRRSNCWQSSINKPYRSPGVLAANLLKSRLDTATDLLFFPWGVHEEARHRAVLWIISLNANLRLFSGKSPLLPERNCPLGSLEYPSTWKYSISCFHWSRCSMFTIISSIGRLDCLPPNHQPDQNPPSSSSPQNLRKSPQSH
jgi:hypothetical protein